MQRQYVGFTPLLAPSHVVSSSRNGQWHILAETGSQWSSIWGLSPWQPGESTRTVKDLGNILQLTW